MKTFTRSLGASVLALVGLSLLIGSMGVRMPVFAGGATGTVRDRNSTPTRTPNQTPGAVRPDSQERYLEITEITGTVTLEAEGLKQQGRPAKVGDRLRSPGEGISTGSNSSAKLRADNNIGTVDVSENSNIGVKSLSTVRNGAKTTDLRTSRGRNRVRVRRFSNPQSRFTIQTPTGVAGVRGTDFTVYVAPSGETRVYTAVGVVEVTGENQTQRLDNGAYSVIQPGKPPTPPNIVSSNLRLSWQILPSPDEGKVKVVGTVNPTSLVLIDGQALELDPAGQFETIATIGSERRLTLLVRNASGEEQVYELVVP